MDSIPVQVVARGDLCGLGDGNIMNGMRCHMDWMKMALACALAPWTLTACDDGKTGSDTEDGPSDLDDGGCTEVGCTSTFTVTLAHTFPRDGDPHQVRFITPTQEITCSIPAGEPGMESCFGFAFANVTWDDESIVLELVEPFISTDDNPDAEPWDTIDVEVTRGGEDIAMFTLDVEAGDPDRPNGADCPPVCWQATASGSIP